MNLDVVATATWRVPVYVRIGYGGSESVQSASEALQYLINWWPSERGDAYENALGMCKAASEGTVSCEVARDAFLAAAAEAHVRA